MAAPARVNCGSFAVQMERRAANQRLAVRAPCGHKSKARRPAMLVPPTVPASVRVSRKLKRKRRSETKESCCLFDFAILCRPCLMNERKKLSITVKAEAKAQMKVFILTYPNNLRARPLICHSLSLSVSPNLGKRTLLHKISSFKRSK